ncbi:unnamed protein product [Leptidea sinapis]|uniref:Uncharacterized protein n=1 Tax=Leptidea sinapis TaxID=189913 RepID=A0A5E4PQ49_9NEOP|nr:unnamed protein product [Leptidea sinapis]
MYRGYSYVEASEYQRGIDLWTWALQLRSTRHTLLYAAAAWRARRTCRVTVTCCACSTCWLTSCLVSTPP